MVTIRLRKNGPYVIESDQVRVIDWNGTEYRAERQPIALCRCGASATKPFCDRTHAKIGFEAGEPAGGSHAADTPSES
jgi:CDGSH iron-sulfur domain-containing protein 3